MTETIVWTLIFFGVDLLAIIGLISFAISKDRQKAAAGEATEQ